MPEADDAQQERILAAIDVGTNSIHMVIVLVQPRLASFTIIAREKQMVRLGEYCLKTGWLKPEAMARALDALRHCKAFAEGLGAQEIIAVATSAVREAPNGPEFLQQIQRVVGLRVDLISGEEEARRIYLGVLSAVELDNRSHVVIDIGGGSTELILGDGHEPRFLTSIKAGAVRLSEQFVTSDPISTRDYNCLQNQVRNLLEPAIDALHSQGSFERLVGTSGTIMTLAEMDARQTGNVPTSLQGYTLTLASLEQLLAQLRPLDLEARRRLPGVSERRADIIVAGAAILLEAMKLLKVESLVVCEAALREGLIVDWMLAHGLIADRLRYQGSVRERSVLHLADKFHLDYAHAEQVSRLALSLFDQTRGALHHWSGADRELLWAAAMLHNCGHFINHSAHHKHSYYLIRHGGMLGFTEEEIEVIANLARYHRKSAPRRKHLPFQQLSKEHKRLVRQLSIFLRLASALDRRHKGAVQAVRCQVRPDQVELHLQPHDPADPCDLELWNAEYKKAEFEQEFGRVLTISLEPAIRDAFPLLAVPAGDSRPEAGLGERTPAAGSRR
ncbi:Ppx/GppA phosphatase family protein [Gloeobacter kilaueensis]|uniref:Ppx/GppA phosphatase n=1 Tax=Gloeobacter kilaueensis (strain ATCC BAA-2537 / CCAP 1431/1 / ULC 316 / JS1) TaxID=1183438 RepID=U5QSE5_GLOK1|nr:Ppx/GppA phosphatase family protein [Gloeobacter kilaueensis]AGY60589.1 Ppx/GppA phosphatase [Gloeobacter kilaueensis JS1]